MKQFDFWETLNKPKWMNKTDPSYVTAMGSRAYGTATEDSDWDFYGFIVPPEEVTFPFLRGDIPEFGIQKKNFQQLQGQHVPSETFGEVDIFIYSLPRYFHLLMQGNPNMIDSIYTPSNVVMYSDRVGEMVRKNRYLFLSQKMWHTFKGMAYSHLNRITSRTREGKRKDYVEKYRYDCKDASHVIRVMLEIEDFLFTGEADLTANGVAKNVRNGEWSLEEVQNFFDVTLDKIHRRLDNGESILPEYPDKHAIKQLLVGCLEEKYGSLSVFGWNIVKNRGHYSFFVK